MKFIAWRYGCRLWIGNRSIGILGPRDTPLFSERQGIRRPIVKVGPWRLYVDYHSSLLSHYEEKTTEVQEQELTNKQGDIVAVDQYGKKTYVTRYERRTE